MPMSAAALRASIDSLTDAGLIATDHDLDRSIDAVVNAAVVLFETTGAGLMLVDDSQVLHYVSASDERAASLEEIQERLGEGPCVDSLVNDEVVRCRDIATDTRWPAVSAAMQPLGLHAILGLPVRVSGAAVGSLNVYHDAARDWDDDDVNAVAAFGRVIEELIGHALLARQTSHIAAQLSYALENRVDIERAVGVLMAQHQLSAVRAFDLLRRQARSNRTKVSEVARQLLSESTFAGE